VFRTIQPVVVTAIALCVSAMPALSAPRNAKPEPAFEEPHGADLNQGKPPSEIFKSDCSVCHKSPQGLAKSGGAGLQGFLRQHYTTGAPQAAAMAGYLASVGGSGAAAKPVSPERPEKPEKPERPERASPAERTQPAIARRPPANEPANDGLTPPPSAKPEKPEAKPESKPAETATAPVAEPVRPGRRGKKQEEAKPTPARPPKIEEAKPAVEPEKPASPEPSTRTAEPAPQPPEPKPAAAPVPEIPL